MRRTTLVMLAVLSCGASGCGILDCDPDVHTITVLDSDFAELRALNLSYVHTWEGRGYDCVSETILSNGRRAGTKYTCSKC